LSKLRSPVASSLPTVLLVDESVDTLEMYAVGLHLAGYQAVLATDAEGGLNELHHALPKAVVTELHLGAQRTAWDFLRDIRRVPEARLVPVILLTGRWQSTLADAAREAGFAAALMKPCSPTKLNHVIDLLSKAAALS
jgi:two-component system, cell cycle response regulator DivK